MVIILPCLYLPKPCQQICWTWHNLKCLMLRRCFLYICFIYMVRSGTVMQLSITMLSLNSLWLFQKANIIIRSVCWVFVFQRGIAQYGSVLKPRATKTWMLHLTVIYVFAIEHINTIFGGRYVYFTSVFTFTSWHYFFVLRNFPCF